MLVGIEPRLLLLSEYAYFRTATVAGQFAKATKKRSDEKAFSVCFSKISCPIGFLCYYKFFSSLFNEYTLNFIYNICMYIRLVLVLGGYRYSKTRKNISFSCNADTIPLTNKQVFHTRTLFRSFSLYGS